MAILHDVRWAQMIRATLIELQQGADEERFDAIEDILEALDRRFGNLLYADVTTTVGMVRELRDACERVAETLEFGISWRFEFETPEYETASDIHWALHDAESMARYVTGL